MKMLRRGTALVLSVALLFSLIAGGVLVIATSNWTNATSLGLLSRHYETGNTSTDVDAAKMISTVDGDPGGKSYGAYMFASKTGTVQNFISWCRNTAYNATNTVAYAIGDKLFAAYYSNGAGCGPLFDQAWLEVAADYGSAFFSTQEAFAKTQIYDKAIAYIRAQVPAFNIDNYSVALKNVIWSRAVHHGPEGASNIVIRAFNALGGFANQSESTLITAIYDESGRVVTPEELRLENGAINAPVMSGSMAKKYAVEGKILRYWYGSSDGVQMAVYRRLNVNEPADALAMFRDNAFVGTTLQDGNYHIQLKKDASSLVLGVANGEIKMVNTADQTASAGKFTLNYLSGARAYTISTTVLNSDNSTSTLRLTANTAGADGFGAVTLAVPSTSDTQLWYIGSDGSVKNKATGTYLSFRNDTLVVVGTEGADMTQTITATSSSDDTVETFTQVLPEGSDKTPETLKVTFVTGETGAITEGSTAAFETGTSSDFVAKKLPDVTAKAGWTFAGWVTENGMSVTAGSIGPAGELTLYARYTATATVSPSGWAFTPVVKDISDFTVEQLVYPDANTVLTAGDSSFPVRGMISCSAAITNVTLVVSGPNTYRSSVAPNATFYDLSDMDSAIAYSRLGQGDYTYTLTATAGGTTVKLAESTFKVGAPVVTPGIPTPPVSGEDVFTVTFDAGTNGVCTIASKTYSLDSIVYGYLPPVVPNSGYGFAGWFTAPVGGVQVLPGTQIVAENITLYAQYTRVSTYTFLSASSTAYVTGSAAAGTLFTAPYAAPAKSPDGQFTYTFSHWVDAAGNKYSSGATIVMAEGGMIFTPVYLKWAISTGEQLPGDGTTTPPAGFWPLMPGTDISQIESPVYKAGVLVTEGNMATGMTTVVNDVEYVITVTGDANGDGKISISDVVSLQAHLLNKTPLTGAYLKAADLNSDGNVTITDLVKSARVVAGKDTIG